MKELQQILRHFERRRGQAFALATLVRAAGSSYRRPGARMLIGWDGEAVGSLSGGCLEEEVVQLARDVIRGGEPKFVAFDTRRRFGCNGSIDIFLEPLAAEFLPELAENFRARRSCVAATNFENKAVPLGSKILKPDEERMPGVFVQTLNPPIRLLVIGEGPDSESFRCLTDLLGWELKELAQVSELPEEIDEWTAAIVKSHNYGRDFSALQALLPRDLRYVGLMGPRKRRDQLLADLFDRAGCMNAGLFAPAGLDLGAETPQEIALAIIAEIQSVFAAASRESLRDRKRPIHAIRYAPRGLDTITAVIR